MPARLVHAPRGRAAGDRRVPEREAGVRLSSDTRALIFWFTGLSGSGKTTVARRAKSALEALRVSVLILDGDDVRERLHASLGFSPADIKTNNALVVELCLRERASYRVILVPVISPFRDSRAAARSLLGPGFFEVHFSADLETVAKRDVKGLYAKARRNEVADLIGVSPRTPYEAPSAADLTIDSSEEPVDRSVAKLCEFITRALEMQRAT